MGGFYCVLCRGLDLEACNFLLRSLYWKWVHVSFSLSCCGLHLKRSMTHPEISPSGNLQHNSSSWLLKLLL